MNPKALTGIVWQVAALLALAACGGQAPSDHPGHEAETNQQVAHSDTLPADLPALLRPTQASVVSSVRVTRPVWRTVPDVQTFPGFIAYDDRRVHGVAARASGRVERLYARYSFQPIRRGQRLLDLYSPDLLTAQQNHLFLLKNDSTNRALLESSRQQLRLLGMADDQLERLETERLPEFAVRVVSPYAGHLHEAGPQNRAQTGPVAPTPMPLAGGGMEEMAASGPLAPGPPPAVATPFRLRQGDYATKGQTLFWVYDVSRVWAVLNLYAAGADAVRPGQSVELTVESNPGQTLHGRIDFLEPVLRENARTMAARVYLANPGEALKIGALLQARIVGGSRKGLWLPRSAVYELGTRRVVWVRTGKAFVARSVQTGRRVGSDLEIRAGLAESDLVAVNAQYLVDSESFIHVSSHEPKFR